MSKTLYLYQNPSSLFVTCVIVEMFLVKLITQTNFSFVYNKKNETHSINFVFEKVL